jgi:deoxyadenosine/deoxycytidine kinase
MYFFKGKGENMKINFTKKEYQTLLEMVYVTDWVLHAHIEKETDKTNETKIYQELEQKILAAAPDFGMENLVACNEKSGANFLSKEFTNNHEILKHIDKFENATFWEELIERLARRNFIKTYGEEAILQMSISERFEKEMIFHQKYHKEFGDNGLNNLQISHL